MEHKDKFQKKFSYFRQEVASKSPVNKSKSNSMIKMGSCSKKNKTKDIKEFKPSEDKRSNISKQRTTNMQTQPSNSTIIHDLQLQLSTLNSTLKHLPLNTTIEITNYYQILKQFVKEMVDSSMYKILKLIHSIYTIPLPTILSKAQTASNICTEQLDTENQTTEMFSKAKCSLNNYLNSSNSSSKMNLSSPASRAELNYANRSATKENSNKKQGVKLDMTKIKQSKIAVKDYFDEFYDNIQEFSESWRQQALRQKR